MKRDIKFRAWDGKRMMFTDRDHFYLIGNEVDIPSQTGDEFYRKEYQIMQFTGLRDKNGKEIYEGDLILDLWTGNRYEVRFGYCEAREFTGLYCYSKEYQTTLNGDYATGQNGQIEVIGNIYENPERQKEANPQGE